jgi:hypothetical protein
LKKEGEDGRKEEGRKEGQRKTEGNKHLRMNKKKFYALVQISFSQNLLPHSYHSFFFHLIIHSRVVFEIRKENDK